MPKYLFQASYTAEGAKGLLKDGGSKRRSAVEELIKSLKGKVEAFYFAFGEPDVFLIVDLPDNASAAAASLTTAASGAVDIKTTLLLTRDEIDKAAKKTVTYRSPGE